MSKKYECGYCKKKFKTMRFIARTQNEPRAGLYYLYDEGYEWVCKKCQKLYGKVEVFIVDMDK